MAAYDATVPVTLTRIVAALEKTYGPMRPEVTDPFEMIVMENVAYLVDDARRRETFKRLRRAIGITPQAILKHSAAEIAAVIADGGMKPEMRAEKVLECARLAARGVTTLRKFPGVGEPLADRILLFAGSKVTLAPDSNALRVLLRLGYGAESKNYAASYRSVLNATNGELRDADFAQRAHLLLRRHGQELCKRTAPRCERCPLRDVCAWYRKGSAGVPPAPIGRPARS
jgi:endonuclease III